MSKQLPGPAQALVVGLHRGLVILRAAFPPVAVTACALGAITWKRVLLEVCWEHPVTELTLGAAFTVRTAPTLAARTCVEARAFAT